MIFPKQKDNGKINSATAFKRKVSYTSKEGCMQCTQLIPLPMALQLISKPQHLLGPLMKINYRKKVDFLSQVNGEFHHMTLKQFSMCRQTIYPLKSVKKLLIVQIIQQNTTTIIKLHFKRWSCFSIGLGVQSLTQFLKKEATRSITALPSWMWCSPSQGYSQQFVAGTY